MRQKACVGRAALMGSALLFQIGLKTLSIITTHIGKKPSQGDGAILRWTVEPCAEDLSERDGEGRLMRAIPDPAGVVMGFRPSYWERRNQTNCLWQRSM